MAILITLRLSDGLQDFKEFGVSITEQKKNTKITIQDIRLLHKYRGYCNTPLVLCCRLNPDQLTFN